MLCTPTHRLVSTLKNERLQSHAISYECVMHAYIHARAPTLSYRHGVVHNLLVQRLPVRVRFMFDRDWQNTATIGKIRSSEAHRRQKEDLGQMLWSVRSKELQQMSVALTHRDAEAH